MTDATFLRISDQGKRHLEQCIDQMRRRQNLTWDEFTDWVREITHLDVSKDTLYRTGTGAYRQSASLMAIIAYAKLGALGHLKFLDSEVNLTFDYIADMLLGKVSANGKATTID